MSYIAGVLNLRQFISSSLVLTFYTTSVCISVCMYMKCMLIYVYVHEAFVIAMNISSVLLVDLVGVKPLSLCIPLCIVCGSMC